LCVGGGGQGGNGDLWVFQKKRQAEGVTSMITYDIFRTFRFKK
jgi:hypothetical protein